MKPRTRATLAALKRAGGRGCTTSELMDAGGERFGARLQELRDAGYEIHSRRESQTSHRYRLSTTPIPRVTPTDDSAAGGVASRRLPALRGGRLYRDRPGFRWDSPPVALRDPALYIDLRPGLRATYWGEFDEDTQMAMAA